MLHCPYCHGWEVRDQAIGVLATGPMSVHQALLFRQLSDDVVFFTHTAPPFAEEQAERSRRGASEIVDGAVTRPWRSSTTASPASVSTTARSWDATWSPWRRGCGANTGLWPGSGCTPVEHPNGVGELLPADPTGRDRGARGSGWPAT